MVAGLGGFVGTALRFLSEQLGKLICGASFPLGTFMANILGCFLIGLFYGWASNRGMSKGMNIFLITGLCGGFTTFSSMSDELEQMLATGQDSVFWLYLGASLILGLIMVALGIICVSPKKTQEVKA